MSEQRILLVENPAQLAVDLGRIRIRRQDKTDSFVLPKDIAVMCLHHHTIALSVHVLRVLAEAGAAVLLTNTLHLPCAWLWPTVGNGDVVRRLRQQMALDGDAHKGELWQAIVQGRLRTQAANLRALGRKGSLRLERLAKTVLPGDTNKCESQGARYYWAHLFAMAFKREKQGAEDVLNVRLNFGYAVLRSMVARSLVLAGLQPALGLGHCNMENPFNLADDFIEPYRFVVERHVAQQWQNNPKIGDFDAQARKGVLEFVAQEIQLGNARYRLPAAIDESVASFVRFLDGRAQTLVLPLNAVSTPAPGQKEVWA